MVFLQRSVLYLPEAHEVNLQARKHWTLFRLRSATSNCVVGCSSTVLDQADHQSVQITRNGLTIAVVFMACDGFAQEHRYKHKSSLWYDDDVDDDEDDQNDDDYYRY